MRTDYQSDTGIDMGDLFFINSLMNSLIAYQAWHVPVMAVCILHAQQRRDAILCLDDGSRDAMMITFAVCGPKARSATATEYQNSLFFSEN